MISTWNGPLAAADRAEGAADVPGRVGPAGQQPLDLLGPRRRGQVEVVVLSPEHRVADRAAHQGQLVPGAVRNGRRARRSPARSGPAPPPRRAGRRPAGRSPAVGDLQRRTRSDSLVVSGGPDPAWARHYSSGRAPPAVAVARPRRRWPAAVVAAVGPGRGDCPSPRRPTPRAAAPPDPTQPLVLRMRSITPDYVPATDRSSSAARSPTPPTEQWTAINVQAFIGSDPITTPAELAAAAQTPVDRRRRPPDHRSRHLRPRRLARRPASRSDVQGPAAALEARGVGPRGLLVRRARARRHRGRAAAAAPPAATAPSSRSSRPR